MERSPHFHFLFCPTPHTSLYGYRTTRLIFYLIHILVLVDMFRFLPSLILVVTCSFP